MTLLVADISSHNTITSWPSFLGSVDGIVVKVTQGTGYVWAGAAAALAQARAAGKCVAVYHFAGNLVGQETIPADPTAEANWFLAHYAHRPGEIIVLDWEPSKAPADPDGWAYAFAERIIAATGVVPMVYLNAFYASRQSQWPKTRSLGCGLWAAWYGRNTGQPLAGRPSFAPWPDPAMWQYTSQGSRPGVVSPPLDLNQFFGTPDQWRAFGTPQSTPGDDMPTAEEIAAAVWSYTLPAKDGLGGDNGAAAMDWTRDSRIALRDVDAILAGVVPRIERIDEGKHGDTPDPWGYGKRIETIQALVEGLTGSTSGTADPKAIAAEILAALSPALAAQVVAEMGKQLTTTPAAL